MKRTEASYGENSCKDVSGWSIVLAFTGIYSLLSMSLTIGYYHLSGDSYEYLTLARNIYRGEGFTRVGLPELFRQPVYPFLVAGVLWSIRDIELAGHLVSLFCGILTIPATFWAARQIVSVRHALLATALLAINPFFAHSGSEVLSETACALFSILAIGFLIQACCNVSYRIVFPGAFFGFCSAVAYLCRSENFLLFPAGIFLLAWNARKAKRNYIFSISMAMIAMVITCLPYWFMLKSATGTFSLSGNSATLIWFQSDRKERPPESFDPAWAPRKFDPIYPYKTHPADFKVGRYIMLNTPELVKRYIVNSLTYLKPLCEMLFFGFGLVLLFIGVLWGFRMIGKDVFSSVLVAFVPMVCFSFREGTERLLIPYLPAASLCMAIGLSRITELLSQGKFLSQFQPFRLKVIVIILLVFVPMTKMMRHIGKPENQRHYQYRIVGEEIRKRVNENEIPIVMAGEQAPGFHAGGHTIAIPATSDYQRLLEQMDRFNARYLVVTRKKYVKKSVHVPELSSPEGHDGLELLGVFPGEIDLYHRVKQD
ncbi:MAG: glycosyltransferase family 39 protein [Candidatus Brocadiaceae bacterium]|nr:glycosyltransferase family 39 protein [Candidatus Brocadiaceae bacterium]